MNVSAWFSVQQHLLSTLAAAVLFIGIAEAPAQHIIYTEQGAQRGEVLGLRGGNLQIKVARGTQELTLARVRAVRMPPPAQFKAALDAILAGEIEEAVRQAEAVLQEWRGLPAPWAEQISGVAGDLHAAAGDREKALAAYQQHQKAYPEKGAAAEVLAARLALAKQEYAEVQQKLQPLVEAALQQEVPGTGPAEVYSQAFYLMGRLHEAQGEARDALIAYLRAAAIYYHDEAAAALAQQQADWLRKANPKLTIP